MPGAKAGSNFERVQFITQQQCLVISEEKTHIGLRFWSFSLISGTDAHVGPTMCQML